MKSREWVNQICISWNGTCSYRVPRSDLRLQQKAFWIIPENLVLIMPTLKWPFCGAFMDLCFTCLPDSKELMKIPIF